MRLPRIEFMWWDGCPSAERALSELREALRETGLADAEIRMRQVVDDEDAELTAFKGSPTILIDGRDAVSTAGDEPVGLSCRIYHLRDGRISPTPDPQDLREALHRAAETTPTTTSPDGDAATPA